MVGDAVRVIVVIFGEIGRFAASREVGEVGGFGVPCFGGGRDVRIGDDRGGGEIASGGEVAPFEGGEIAPRGGDTFVLVVGEVGALILVGDNMPIGIVGLVTRTGVFISSSSSSMGISTPFTTMKFLFRRWLGFGLLCTYDGGGGGVHFVHLRGDAGGVSGLPLEYRDGAGLTNSSSEGPKWCFKNPLLLSRLRALFRGGGRAKL
jgi:hypothetical protein